MSDETGVPTALDEHRIMTALVSSGFAEFACEPEWFGLRLTRKKPLSVAAQDFWDELVVEYGWHVISEDRIETGRRPS